MFKKTGIIYKATSPSGKVYIGQTIRLLAYRKDVHRKRATGKCKTDSYYCKFYNAIRKYGIDRFKWTVLYKDVPKSQLNYLECLAIIYYDSYDNGYNSTWGGDINPMSNPESIKKMKRSLTGRKIGDFSEEHKLKIKAANELYWSTHPQERTDRQQKRAKNLKPLSVEKKQQHSYRMKEYYKNHPEKILSKISDEQVIEIRRLSLSGVSTKEIAALYSISISTAKGISNGNQRKKVQGLLSEVRQRANINRRNGVKDV